MSTSSIDNPLVELGSQEITHAEETVILSAKLSEKWLTYRFWTCVASSAHLCPLFTPLYWCFCHSCRKEEMNSFRLSLTAHSLHCEFMHPLECHPGVLSLTPLQSIFFSA